MKETINNWLLGCLRRLGLFAGRVWIQRQRAAIIMRKCLSRPSALYWHLPFSDSGYYLLASGLSDSNLSTPADYQEIKKKTRAVNTYRKPYAVRRNHAISLFLYRFSAPITIYTLSRRLCYMVCYCFFSFFLLYLHRSLSLSPSSSRLEMKVYWVHQLVRRRP